MIFRQQSTDVPGQRIPQCVPSANCRSKLPRKLCGLYLRGNKMHNILLFKIVLTLFVSKTFEIVINRAEQT